MSILDECFTETCPPLKETFSGKPYPCPDLPPQGGRPCLYSDFCKDEHERMSSGNPSNGGEENRYNLRTILTSSYQAPIHVTLAEPSGSFVLRSEHHFHGKEMFRMSLRRHLYEILNARAISTNDGSTFPPNNRCPELNRSIRLGQYIGYLDLRRHYQTAALAFGVLAVPRKLQEDPDAHVITGNYSPLFGGPAFACNIYSRQDNDTAGAACAQACMIMVLGMLSDRGARLEGSYTLTQLGYAQRMPSRQIPQTVAALAEDPEVEQVFPALFGLTPLQIVHALQQLGCNAVKVSLNQPPEGPHQETRKKATENLAQRMIECYVQARYPVILAVEPNTWAGKLLVSESTVGHAVTVVGLRKASLQRRSDQLIIHDPAKQPFVERPVDFCFEACWKNRSRQPAIEMIMAAEQSVTRPLIDCLLKIWDDRPRMLELLLVGNSKYHPSKKFDCQFALLYRKDIHTFLWPVSLATNSRIFLDQQFSLQADRYWCIAGYEDGRLKIVWFFDVNSGEGEEPELQLFFNAPARCSLRKPGNNSTALTLPEVLIHALQ